ncbi:MAG: fibronectin type III domain-containing protein [Armatimonadota bacterium]|nr:fibronectin type III domain-containing protein [Armatimonadota bacterium]
MTAIRSSKLVGPLSIVLAGMMLALLVPTSVMSRAEAQAQKRLLLYPVLDRSEAGYEDLSAWATSYLQMALSDVAGLRVAEFSRTAPMVLRAVEEGQIRSVDLEAEVTDPVTAIRLGYALDVDEVCLATVDSVEILEEPLRAEVLLNGRCYDVRGNVDPDTMEVAESPKPVETFGVSGTSREREAYTGSVPPLVREALRDAARKASSVLAGMPAEELAAEEGPKKEDKSWRWAIAALAVMGLIIATGDDGGGGAGPTATKVPPRPGDLQIEPAAIRLFWQPPNTTLTVLSYDLQRSTDNGATWNPVPGSQGNVLADDTSFADFEVDEGVSYRYRIRAQFTTTGPSPWAEFDSVVFPG